HHLVPAEGQISTRFEVVVAGRAAILVEGPTTEGRQLHDPLHVGEPALVDLRSRRGIGQPTIGAMQPPPGVTNRAFRPRKRALGLYPMSWPGTSSIFGVMVVSSSSAMRVSSRPRAAPRQRWAPLPNARWSSASARSTRKSSAADP